MATESQGAGGSYTSASFTQALVAGSGLGAEGLGVEGSGFSVELHGLGFKF